MDRIYLDNAATTQIDRRVFEKMIPFLNEFYGNPSSIHSFGRKVRVALEDSRESIANLINADPSEIYFTSGGTEADNFAIKKISDTVYSESKRNRIAISNSEHHAVIDSAKSQKDYDFEIDYIPNNEFGSLDNISVKDIIGEQTALCSIMHINNETGSVNKIDEFAQICKQNSTIFHSDCVQSFGKFPIDVKKLNVDSISASAHKIHGPKGIGFLYVKSGTPIDSFLHGGAQERNRRGGTENIASIIGFAEAAKLAVDEMESTTNHVTKLKNLFWDEIRICDPNGIAKNGNEENSPYVLSLTFSSDYYNIDPESMLMYFDINNLAISNGAACSSGTLKPSHVITSMGKSVEDAKGTFRISFSKFNSQEEILSAVKIFYQFIKKFKK